MPPSKFGDRKSDSKGSSDTFGLDSAKSITQSTIKKKKVGHSKFRIHELALISFREDRVRMQTRSDL